MAVMVEYSVTLPLVTPTMVAAYSIVSPDSDVLREPEVPHLICGVSSPRPPLVLSSNETHTRA